MFSHLHSEQFEVEHLADMEMVGVVSSKIPIQFRFCLSICFALLCQACAVRAQEESHATKNPVTLRFCSQNLHNYGEFLQQNFPHSKKSGFEPPYKQHEKQRRALVERFVREHCDLIGVQEIKGGTQRIAESRLKELSTSLSQATQRVFTGITGEIVSGDIRNGLLIATDTLQVERIEKFDTPNLPRLQLLGPGRRFSRYPLKVRLKTVMKDGAPSKEFLVVVTHAKSKVEGWKDPTHTSHEVTRMEMAEALRDVLEEEYKPETQPVTLVMGDFNAQPESASLDILSGRRILDDFRSVHGCAVNAELQSDCPSKIVARKPVFLGLFAQRRSRGEPALGSLRYRGRLELIDDIYVESGDLPLFQSAKGEVAAWTQGTLGEGSDHKLMIAEAKW